jgi:hypothetical protein
METVKVYSPVNDENIKKNLEGSPIWKKAYTAEELVDAKKSNTTMYEYSIKFDGLKPVQLSDFKKLVD